MTEKKYGDPDFGCTLAELKQHAELAQTVQGVSFEGPARKVGAILAVAGAGAELIAEIEQLHGQRDELIALLNRVRLNVPQLQGMPGLLSDIDAAIAKAKGGAA